jgi:phosphoglycerate dehydrogenase-like enzyme
MEPTGTGGPLGSAENGNEVILVLDQEPSVFAGPIRERAHGASVAECASYDDLERALAERRPSIVLASKLGRPFPRDALFACPSLRWIQTASAGVDHLLPIDPRVIVTSASGVHDEVIADYVICAALMWNLRFPGFIRKQRERRWEPQELARVRGQTLAVLGLGRIGALAAEKAGKLGMRVVGVKARPEIAPAGVRVDEVRGVEHLREVASEADFLAVTLPLTPRTRGIVDGRALQSMKRGSVLIDVSRGGIVDERALVTALREGPLAGAVRDVFDEEPLPPESELWNLDNLVVTPHTGDIEGWQRRVVELFCENLERWRAGRALENVVDPGRGY